MIDIVSNLTQTHKYIKDEKTKIAHILEKYKGNILGLDCLEKYKGNILGLDCKDSGPMETPISLDG